MDEIAQKHPGKKIEVWFEDEARLGQKGTLTRVWAKRGSRPIAIQQTEYQYVYVLAAINAREGKGEGMIFSSLNTEVMNLFLEQLGESLAEDSHMVLILDQAGYHLSKQLRIPENITLIHLPPYSPELNPVENLWHYLRSHSWSNRYYKDKSALEEMAIQSWQEMVQEPRRIQTVCATSYVSY